MAAEQTELAFERTKLTNAQTLLAYTRTSIGLLAAGIGMFEFVNNQTVITLGVIIMLIAPVVEAIGIIHFVLTRRRLTQIAPLEHIVSDAPTSRSATSPEQSDSN